MYSVHLSVINVTENEQPKIWNFDTCYILSGAV